MANGQYDSSHYQHSTNRASQALHTLDLKVISPLFSTELNINMGLMGLIKLKLANQPTSLEIG